MSDHTQNIVENGKICLTLGGDHSMAIGKLFIILKNTV